MAFPATPITNPPSPPFLIPSPSPPYSSLGSIVTICGAIGTLVGLLATLFAFKFQTAPIFKTAQPIFCMLFALCIGLLNVTSILDLGEATDAMCFVRPAAFNLLFTLGFGAMVCKMHRVVMIFHNKSLKKMTITDGQLASSLMKLVAVDVIVLGLWAVLSPPEAIDTEVGIDFGVTALERTCKSKSDIYQTILYFYKFVILLTALNFAVKSRDLGVFSESKEIGSTIFSIVGLTIVAAIAFIFMDEDGKIMIKAVVTLLATCISMGLFFGPKFLQRKSTMAEYKADNATSSHTSGNTSNNTSAGKTSDGGGDCDTASAMESMRDRTAELEAQVAKLTALCEANGVKME